MSCLLYFIYYGRKETSGIINKDRVAVSSPVSIGNNSRNWYTVASSGWQKQENWHNFRCQNCNNFKALFEKTQRHYRYHGVFYTIILLVNILTIKPRMRYISTNSFLSTKSWGPDDFENKVLTFIIMFLAKATILNVFSTNSKSCERHTVVEDMWITLT